MAVRASKKLLAQVFDWSAISSKIPASSAARVELNALRTKHEQLRAKNMQFPEEPKAIDFSYYRNRISAPGFVDQMEKAYKDLAAKVPYPPDNYSDTITAREKEADEHFASIVREARLVTKELEASIKFFEDMGPFEHMSPQIFDEHFPTVKEEVYRRLEEKDDTWVQASEDILLTNPDDVEKAEQK